MTEGGGPVLLEITKMEQRYEAVLGILRGGLAVREVDEAFSVSRQKVHAWLRHYEAGGLEALQ
jgi:transposase